MDWIQFTIFIGSTLGALWLFYNTTEKHIDKLEATMQEWRNEHKQDIAKMDEKITKMDEKWERLFTLFVTQRKN